MMFVMRRLQEFARDKKTPFYACFLDLQKAYDLADRTILWEVLRRFGVPRKLVSIIRQYLDGMKVYFRLDDGESSDRFSVD